MNRNFHMTENQVENWFERNNLSSNILNFLWPCNGITLMQMYRVRKDAPEFYFNRLSDIGNTSISEVLLFTSCLEKLFEQV